ncbi:MAG: hypothetical protein V2A61_07860, partial [Calditrichota bacterium]
VNPAPNGRVYFNRQAGVVLMDDVPAGNKQIAQIIGLPFEQLINKYQNSEEGKDKIILQALTDTDLYTCPQHSWIFADGKLYVSARQLVEDTQGWYLPHNSFALITTEEGGRFIDDVIVRGFKKRIVAQPDGSELIEFVDGQIVRVSDNQPVINLKTANFLKPRVENGQVIALSQAARFCEDMNWLFKLPRFERLPIYSWREWFLGTRQLLANERKRMYASEGKVVELDLAE